MSVELPVQGEVEAENTDLPRACLLTPWQKLLLEGTRCCGF